MNRFLAASPIPNLRGALPAVLLLLWPACASAQWDTHWNESGPHPMTCLFNSQEFYVGDDVCIASGVKEVCLADGSLGTRALDADCTGPEASQPAMTKAHGRSGIACTFDASKFSVGAEVCVGPGRKRVCQADGNLGSPAAEVSCKDAVLGAGG